MVALFKSSLGRPEQHQTPQIRISPASSNVEHSEKQPRRDFRVKKYVAPGFSQLNWSKLVASGQNLSVSKFLE